MSTDECSGWAVNPHQTELECFSVWFEGYEAGEDEAEILCSDCVEQLKADPMWLDMDGKITIWDNCKPRKILKVNKQELA